ncbi:MAG TPA: FCD domain-containing protein [Arthrobacter sp.]|nr:FCD domain-containing protein [Arthrobacter sp.]
MDAPDIDRETFHALDARFHVALSALAANAVIETMMESLSGSIRGYVKEALDAFEQWPDVLAELRCQHHDIFDAVQAGDGDRAAVLLRSHITWFYDQTRQQTPAGP